MHLPVISLPRAVPTQSSRPPQANIPQTKAERDQITAIVRGYVERYRPVPPMPIPELREHADRIVAAAGLDPAHRDYVGVIVSNEAWRDTLATIPYERRLLLMPKCLRVEARCPAPFDEFGLLCKKCGLCSIQDLQTEAERLGYAVLVAEGSAIVMAIIETGKIDAIVGVSCLSVLERAFPQMEAAAIPGIAIPLLQDDCIDTNVDIDAVWDVIHLTSDDKTYRLDLDGIRREVQGWFEADALDRLMGPASDETGRIARDWLTKAGKRWRPFLTACAYLALRDDRRRADRRRRCGSAAVAVECFHKASLIHDDIEDGDADALRRGGAARDARRGGRAERRRLPARRGLSPAGRRSTRRPRPRSRCCAPPPHGHRTLTEGQGAELCWARAPQGADVAAGARHLPPQDGAGVRGGAARRRRAARAPSEDVRDVFAKYSEALGIAYQIRDDLDDLHRRPTRPTTSPRCVRRCRWRSASSAPRARTRRRTPRCSRPGGATPTDTLRRAARPADRAERRGSLPPPARLLQGRGDPLARRARRADAQGPAPPHRRQDLQRHRAEGLVP